MKDKVLLFLVPLAINFLIRLISLTCRVRLLFGQSESFHPGRLDARTPCLYAFWHGQLLYTTYPFRRLGTYGIVSRSRDGEYLARLLKGWGFRLIRGSTSRGWATVYKASVRVLGQGGKIGLAPDGPRGPYHRVNPGVVRMAWRAGCPILPLGVGFSRCIRLKSWDRFQIPLPFSKIVILAGEPLNIPSGTSRHGFQAVELQLENTLNRLTEEAERTARA
jgi:lysophospholipid acyltransferase (LPLAT)-like uncharacterized protein